MKCSIYRNVYDRDGLVVDVERVLEGIREGKWEDSIREVRRAKGHKRNELKKDLPGVTFSGIFETRKDDELIDHNGLITLDIDHISEVGILQEALRKDPYCFSAFRSPSGDGLKVLFRTDCDGRSHRDAYEQVRKYMERKYRVEVDEKASNESRLCFVSHDPQLFTSDPEIIKVKKKKRKRPPPPKGAPTVTACIKMTERRAPNVEGNRNNHVHLLACHLNRAGVPYQEAEQVCSRVTDLPYKEVANTVKGVYRRNEHEHGITGSGLWS